MSDTLVFESEAFIDLVRKGWFDFTTLSFTGNLDRPDVETGRKYCPQDGIWQSMYSRLIDQGVDVY